MKKYLTIFSSQGSLKRWFALVAGNICLFGPEYCLYNNLISGNEYLNYWLIMGPTLITFYIGGKIVDNRLPKTETKSEAVQFTAPVKLK